MKNKIQLSKLSFYILILIIGFLLGIFFTYQLISIYAVSMISHLNIQKVEVGFNETYIMDRMENMINDSREIKLNCNGTIIDNKGMRCLN